jgi:uncharacterized protein YraI
MKYRNLMAAATLSLLAGMPLAAQADAIRGYTNASVDLLAGPGADFPPVAHVANGANVDIIGCVDGFKWCDVGWAGNRGWIDGNYIDSIYKDRHVKIIEYGPQEDVPVVTFEQKSYWDNYYHDRPFYTEQRYWHSTTTTPP